MEPTVLIAAVVVAALVFDFCNGWNDSANAIATVVSTRVLSPLSAVILAGGLNFVGGLLSEEVASTVGTGLVDPGRITQTIVLAAMISGSLWVGAMTWLGMPISGTHSLVGGLIGAAGFALGVGALEGRGVGTVLAAMLISPLAGLAVGFAVMAALMWAFRRARPVLVNRLFGKLQLVSVGAMACVHGMNDAQKVMGVITVALVAGGLHEPDQALRAPGPATVAEVCVARGDRVLPRQVVLTVRDDAGRVSALVAEHGGRLRALRVAVGARLAPGQVVADVRAGVPLWVKLACSFVIALGTCAGGWKVIRTLGMNLIKIRPIHGFAAETGASLTLALAATWGVPVSTTHTITGAIMGVGATQGLYRVRWGLGKKIVLSWILTLPLTALLGGATWGLLRLLGLP